MNRKTLIIATVVAALVLVALAIVLMFFLPKKQAANLNENVSNAKVNKPVNVPLNVNVIKPQVKQEDQAQSELSRIATSFAERYGSYSNQSNFENVTSLQVYMTDSMKKWSNQFVKSNQQNALASAIYYGITTKAISTKLDSFTDQEADFTITTQRKEATGTTDNAKIYYQDISIKFAKEQNLWKVEEAKWLEVKS